MKFKELTEFFQKLESTASRNQMTEILARLLASATVEEIDKICYLSLGRLAPLYAGVEFNLAEKMMVRALALAYGQEESVIRKKFKSVGDLGDVAALFDRREKTKSLSVVEVFERLVEVAADGGEGSVDRKIQKTASILDDLDAQGSKYVVRIPLGRLRLGFSDKTILDALSWMISGDKSKRDEIEAAYNVQADVGVVAKKLKIKNQKLKTQIKDKKKRVEKLVRELALVKPQLGVPIMPALCQRLPTAEKMVEKMAPKGSKEKVAVEPKYDGTRLQIHFSRKKKWQAPKDQLVFSFQPQGLVRIFTRNLENVTHMFPDIVQALFVEAKASEVILDCEAIGFDPKTGKLLPFQETIKRKRKYGIGQKATEIPLRLYVFDLLFKDGRGLLQAPFSQRRQALEAILPAENQTVTLSPQILTDDPERLLQYHEESINKGLEGVVVKKWRSSYDPGKRGYTWVKFKQEKGKKGGGLADTLDCVIMGYYSGRGKRAGFGIGMFLVGVRKEEKIVSVSKVGTGLTDDQWREMKRRCEKVKTSSKPKQYRVHKDLFPDVWCQPEIVVEIEADNITNSPIHTAGYAFRFPRLIRFRDRKLASQATTLKETKELFNLQK